jgi:Flp pilus assembly secretin CpaC
MRKVLSLALLAASIVSANAQMQEAPNVTILKTTTALRPEIFYMGDREANYVLNTALPYEAIRIVDPQVVDVIPISNRKITIVPASNTIGDTHLMFYDSNKNLIKDLHVQIVHQVRVLARLGMTPFAGMPGGGGTEQRHAETTYWTCWAYGCDLLADPQYKSATLSYSVEHVNR